MRYVPEDFYMARIPIKSLEDFYSAEDEDDLLYFMNDSEFMEALFLANKEVYDKLISRGIGLSEKVKLLGALKKIYSRAATRTIPFGLYTIVNSGIFINKPYEFVHKTTDWIKDCQVDYQWLFGIIRSIERDSSLMKCVEIRFNDCCYVSGSRLVNPYLSEYGQAYNNEEEVKKMKGNKNSIRITKQVIYIMEKCKEFIRFDNLLELLQSKNPNTDEQVLVDFLLQLIENEILISELRPPIHCRDPLAYIIDKFERYNMENLSIIKDLKIIKELIKSYNRSSIADSKNVTLLSDVYKKMSNLYIAPSYLRAVLGSKQNANLLHYNVKKELNKLSQLLIAFSIRDNEFSTLYEYKKKFLDMYGDCAEINILELFDPNKGIGNLYALGNKQALKKNESNKLLKIKKLLDDKITTATLNRKDVDITKDDLNYIRGIEDIPKEIPLSSSFALQFTVEASSYEAIVNDNFLIHITPNMGSNSSTNVFNRFSYVLNKYCLKNLESLYKKIKDYSNDEYIIVEACELSRGSKANNISAGISHYDYNICMAINENYHVTKISLKDIYVGLNQKTNRFYLKSKKLNQKLKVIADSMLNGPSSNPYIRFMREVSYAYELHPIDGLFTFKNIDKKYCPRIKYGNIVLQEKRWRIDITDFKNINDYNTFQEEIYSLFDNMSIPSYIYYNSMDYRIPLSKSCDNDLHYMRKELIKKGYLLLSEIDFNKKWLADNNNLHYLSEFCVPFTLDSPIEINKFENKYNRIVDNFITSERTIYPFDGKWLFYSIYCKYNNANRIIGKYLPLLLNDLKRKNIIEKFFYIKYGDPEFHIRVRFEFYNPNLVCECIQTFNQWYDQLIKNNLSYNYSINTYIREVERYGGTEAIEIAEEFFCADSVFIQNYIQKYLDDKNINWKEELAFSLLFETLKICLVNINQCDEFFIDQNIYRDQYREEYKVNKKMYSAMLLKAINNFDEDIPNRSNRRDILMKFSEKIFELENKKELTNSRYNIIRSIIHMSFNRLDGNINWEERTITMFRHTMYTYLKQLENYAP